MENTREGSLLSDKDILNNVAKAVNRTITMLAEDLGEKKGTLYQVTTGRNHISTRIKAKLIDNYPNLNPEYIETGRGEILIKRPSESNDAFKEEIFMQLSLLNQKVNILSDKMSSLILALNKKM